MSTTMIIVLVAGLSFWAISYLAGRALGAAKRKRVEGADRSMNDLFKSMGRDIAIQSIAHGSSTPTQAAQFVSDQSDYLDLMSKLSLSDRQKLELLMEPLGGDYGLRLAYVRRFLNM